MFSIVVGIASLAGAWKLAAQYTEVPRFIAESLIVLAVVIYLALTILTLMKWILRTRVAVEELDDWIVASLTGLFFVASQLIANLLIPISGFEHIGFILFLIALFGQLAYTTLYFLPRCFTDGHADEALTPALYIPFMATNLTSAMVAANVGWLVLGQVLLGVAVIAWLILEPIILKRWLFGCLPPIEQRPLLGVETAPPVVVCLTWLTLFPHDSSAFVWACLGWGSLLIVVCIRLLFWWSKVGFVPTFWSFSFGAGAFASCLIHLSLQINTAPIYYISLLVLFSATFFISWLFYKTLLHHLRNI
jgi:tellurite resistance protein